MIHTRHLVAILVAFASSLVAQDPPQPAPELAKFDRMIGHWRGEGTVFMQPGAPASPWTSFGHVRKVMGGHCLREDTCIDFGEGAPGTLRFITYYAWDGEQQQYVQLTASNMGEASLTEISFVDDETMVTTAVSFATGQRAMGHWRSRFVGDEVHMDAVQAVDGGEVVPHVHGKMVRVAADEIPADALGTAGMFGGPAAPEMARLVKACGHYTLTGKMTPAPGMDAVDISGTDEIRAIFGGSIVELETAGAPFDYMAWAAFGWNPHRRCYDMIYVNNMGEVGAAETRWIGDDLVSTNMSMRKGQPTLARAVFHMDEHGAFASTHSTVVMGVSEPATAFEGVYEKRR